ncbi:UNVERIFIED_CONTAM: hypothetical protein FKN15_018958 [Acipenser sinensis]
MDVPNMPCFFIYPELPKAVLTSSPEWGELYTGETVTLSCGVEGGFTGWEYLWYKSSQRGTEKIRDTTGARYTFSPVTQSHSGQYQCEAQRGDRPRSSQRSDPVTLTVSELPKAVLTSSPEWGELYTGETVTLSCEVEGGFTGWRYLWYKSSQGGTVQQIGDAIDERYTIRLADQSHSGEYWCGAQGGDRPRSSQRSNPVTLTVSELPKAVLTSSPQWGELYTGETVTLSCGVEGRFTGWRYLWYKSSQGGTVQQIGDTIVERYTIRLADQSHSGQYWCGAQGGYRPRSSQRSNPVTLTVSAGRPKPVLTREPAGKIFEGDTVTLSCVVEGGSDGWRYLWYKDSQYSTSVYQTDSSSKTGAGYTISAAALSQSIGGEYWCLAGRGSKPFYSQYSNAVKIQVSERFSTPTLTVRPDASVWEGEAVILQCGAQINKQGTQLQYRYIKDNGNLRGPGSRDPYSIPAAGLRDTGSYQCEVEVAGTGVKKRSDSVWLFVSELFKKPILTFTPASPVWEGEAVTLQCGAQIYKHGTQLQYRYIKDNGNLRGAGSRNPYSIPAAVLKDTGSYQCEVEAAGTGVKKRSDSVSLTVRELPQTTLTLEPPFPEICTRETVTLRCGVKGGSAGWKYLWYKDSEDTPVPQTAGRSITGDSYTITAAAVSDQGQYCCRGQRGDQPLYSQLSDKVILTVSDVRPKAVLTLQPAWAQIFTKETVTLSCEVEGCSAGWRFKQYRDGREKAWCSDQYSRRDGHSCTISNAQNSHSGVYWCESGQERSNAVTLTVSNGQVILQTPPQPVIEGDALTLRCHVRYGYTATWVTFYKDSKELQSQADTERSVDHVSKSDEGSYKCRAWWSSHYYPYSGDSGDSAEVRVSVRELFSRVTLTASPGATVKEGEALNLTCEAAVNKTPRPELHYTIVRDGEPVTNSTDSALYSIASTEKSHTANYTCAVESQGVKKSSQELHIEVQKSWSWIIAALSISLVLIVIHSPLLSSQSPGRGSLPLSVSLVLIVIHSPLLSPQSPGRGSLDLSVSLVLIVVHSPLLSPQSPGHGSLDLSVSLVLIVVHSPLLSPQSPGHGSLDLSVSLVLIVVHSPLLSPQSPGHGSLDLSVSLVLIVVHSPLLSPQSPGHGSLDLSVSLVLIVVHSPLLSPQSPGHGSLDLSVSLVLIVVHSPLLSPQSPGHGSLDLSVSLVLIVVHSPLLSPQSPGHGSLDLSVSLVLIVVHSPLLSPQSPGHGSLLLSVSRWF